MPTDIFRNFLAEIYYPQQFEVRCVQLSPERMVRELRSLDTKVFEQWYAALFYRRDAIARQGSFTTSGLVQTESRALPWLVCYLDEYQRGAVTMPPKYVFFEFGKLAPSVVANLHRAIENHFASYITDAKK